MELVIDNDNSNSEKDNTNTNNNTNIQKPAPKTKQEPKKKSRITYEKILESMNMKVIDGKLVMRPQNKDTDTEEDTSIHAGLKKENRWNKKVVASIPENNQMHQYQQQQYQQQPYQEQTQQPLTPEQIKQMLWANEMKRRQEINRIREVKSTKLFFSTPNETARGNIIYNNQGRIGYNMFKLNR